MKKAVVTGANGYVGRHLISALVDEGYEIYGVDICPQPSDKSVIHMTKDIFTDDENIYTQLGCPDLLIHLAWRNGFRHDHLSHLEDLPKHYRFLNRLIQAGIPKLAVLGSMHEVGYWNGEVCADTPCKPLSLYGIAKNALRQSFLLQSEQCNTKLYWLRGYYFYGDDQHNHSIFSKIYQWEIENRKTFPFNSGKNKYDFIHIDDFASCVAKVLSQDSVLGTIDVCTGTAITLQEKIEKYLEENNYSIRPIYGQFPDRPYDSPALWGNREKLDAALSSYEVEH